MVAVCVLCLLFPLLSAQPLAAQTPTNEILVVQNERVVNRVDLTCRTPPDVDIIDALFCSRGPQQQGPGNCSRGISTGHFIVDVTPESEAIWTCQNSTFYSSVVELWIAARPTPPDGMEFRKEALPGANVELECDYQRGRLRELYSVEWFRIQDNELRRSANEGNNTVNYDNFSLTVDPVVIGNRYVCEVTVECIVNPMLRCSQSITYRQSGNTIVLVDEDQVTLQVITSTPDDSTTSHTIMATNATHIIVPATALSTLEVSHWPILLVIVLVFIPLIIATVLVAVGCTYFVMKRRRISTRETVQLKTIKQSTSATSIVMEEGRIVMQQMLSNTETNVTSVLPEDSGNYTQSTENGVEVQAVTPTVNHAVSPPASSLMSSMPNGRTDSVSALPIVRRPSSYSGRQSNVPSTHPSSVCTVLGQLEAIECVQPASNIPFIGPLEVFLCSSLGGTYQTPHDVSIRIQKGAIPEGHTFRIEFGIALYGPFDYPGESKAISPIIMLRVFSDSTDQITKLLLPIKIKLPHHFDLCEDDIAQNKVGFMVASLEDEDERVCFKPGNGKCSFRLKQLYGTITTEDFSDYYYCLTCANYPELSISRGLYTLVKVTPQPVPAKAWDMHFCITYFMKPFIERIQRQYRGLGVKVATHPQWRFKFSPPESEDTEPAIGIVLHLSQPETRWQLTLEPNVQQIEFLELDVWRNDPMHLCSQEEDRHYPPRFTVEVSGEAAVQSTEVLVSFTGIDEKFVEKMKTRVSLPCINAQGMGQAVIPFAVPPQHLPSMNQAMVPYTPLTAVPGYQLAIPGPYPQLTYRTDGSQSLYTADKQYDPNEPSDEELFEAAKDITGKLGTSWTMLLTYLQIPKHLAADIETDRSLLSAVYRTLQMWPSLNKEKSTNMREDLANLLEKTDPRLHSVSRKLREGGARH